MFGTDLKANSHVVNVYSLLLYHCYFYIWIFDCFLKKVYMLHRAFGLSLATLKQQPCWSPQILVMALPVAVVTGANSGLGLALSVKLAKNHLVFAGMRSLAKKDQAEKG